MSEPVTQGQFFERMQQLEDRLQEYHRRSREHIDERADRIMAAMGALASGISATPGTWRILMLPSKRAGWSFAVLR